MRGSPIVQASEVFAARRLRLRTTADFFATGDFRAALDDVFLALVFFFLTAIVRSLTLLFKTMSKPPRVQRLQPHSPLPALRGTLAPAHATAGSRGSL